MSLKKHLIAYQISGQTVGIDIETWQTADLNGNAPFKIILSGQTMPSGYTNIDTIVNWDRFALAIANDYSVVKFGVKEMAEETGWTGLTNTEKDLCVKYYAYPDTTTAVIYLMTTKGWSQAQASGFVLQSWHKHHLKNIVAYSQRWNYAKLTVLSYIEVGILGWTYNDFQDGIVDYIYSTHGFTGQGLEENGYVLQQGTWADFKQALDMVLVCGIYSIYTDLNNG